MDNRRLVIPRSHSHLQHHNRRAIRMLTLGCLLIAGCGGKGGGGNGNNNNCPEGFRPEGRACVPIFDDCPGPAEIPILGGGCQPVGVTQCATGFVTDGEGGCDPILPSDPCPAGTMEVIGETECQPVGVTQCADGFVSDGEGGCDAILPPGPDPCPFGTMEVLGHTECQPIGDCGTGTWGNITTDATTVYVDQTADATGADGSDASPFTTIADALAVVVPGGQIAVAAGDYVERLFINQPVHLAGRCAERVTIRGRFYLGQDRPPVTINAGGSGTSVRGVTLTGDAEGLVVNGATDVTVEEVQVVDTGYIGISLEREAEASLGRVLAARCTGVGILSEGSTVEVLESVVRDTNPLQDGTYGRGVNAQCASGGACGTLTVTGTLVAGNREFGIFAAGADGAITSTVVRDTLPRQNGGTGGRGISAQCDLDLGACGSLTVTGSLVTGNREVGILALGSDAAITSTVVRDTLPEQGGETAAEGIVAQCHPDLGTCGRMTVTGCFVAGNRLYGIDIGGADAVIASTVVRNTLSRESDGTGGAGIGAQCHPDLGTCGSLTVTGSLVAGNRRSGILIEGADAAITSTLVTDTLPQESDGMFGRGIETHCDSSGACGNLTVTGSLVTGNRDVGVLVIGVDAAITSTVVRDTLPAERDGMFGRGINAQCYPGLGVCGSLTVTGSLVAANRDVGIVAFGAGITITSTVVRDTLPRQGDGKFGRGIDVQCHPGMGTCGELAVTASLVAGNENAGISITGAHAVLSGVAVKDTVPNENGDWAGDHGQGIVAKCAYPAEGRYCAVVQMSECLVDSSHSAGVSIQGGSGSILGSLIRNVYSRPLDDAFGYGLQVEGLASPEAGQTFFDVQSSRIIDATLAGALYLLAHGTVNGSEVSGAGFSIVMSQGASVTVTDDNLLSGQFEDEPSWQNMESAPAPEPPLPMEIL